MRKMALILLSVLFLPLTIYAAGPPAQAGNHYGEEKYLEYSIEYLEPLGVTTADENGITFAPFGSGSFTEGTILPEIYFGNYPLYFSGGILNFKVMIKNTGPRTFRNLKVMAGQEFLNTLGGAGEGFGEMNEWFLEEIGAGEEIILEGSFSIPTLGVSGIDQTHLKIIHWGKGEGDSGGEASGKVIVDDPQAGLWCPI